MDGALSESASVTRTVDSPSISLVITQPYNHSPMHFEVGQLQVLFEAFHYQVNGQWMGLAYQLMCRTRRCSIALILQKEMSFTTDLL